MNKLDATQRICLQYLALTGQPLRTLRNYQRVADGRPIFEHLEEKHARHSALRSCQRALESFRQGSRFAGAYPGFPRDFNLDNHIEPKPDRPPTLPKFDFLLYQSQFIEMGNNPKPNSRRLKAKTAKARSAGMPSDYESDSSMSSKCHASTEEAFSGISTIGPGGVSADGIRYDITTNIVVDSKGMGLSGFPFNIMCSCTAYGAIVENKALSVLSLTFPLGSLCGIEASLIKPLIASGRGEELFFNMTTAKTDLVSLTEAAFDKYDEVERFGGKNTSRSTTGTVFFRQDQATPS